MILGSQGRVYVCMYVCMHVCMYACMRACMHACTHGCMYVCMHACMHVPGAAVHLANVNLENVIALVLLRLIQENRRYFFASRTRHKANFTPAFEAHGVWLEHALWKLQA